MKKYILFLAVAAMALAGCEKEPEKDDAGDWHESAPSVTLISSGNNILREVNHRAGSFTIYATSNSDWQAKVDASSPWMKISIGSGEPASSLESEQSSIIRISYEQSDIDYREGQITFTSGENSTTFTVKQSQTFTNPIAGIPDPWIVKHNNIYYTCKAHGDGAGDHVNISTSDKLTVINSTKKIWTAPKDAGIEKPWNTSHIWAPEMHHIDGKWYIYYTAGRPAAESAGSYKLQRSGVLECDSQDPLTGTWTDKGMLYTGDEYVDDIVATADNTAYAIDLTVATINGQLYAIWSGGPKVDNFQATYIAKMSSPTTISSSRVQISSVDETAGNWERTGDSRIQEGQIVMKNAGKVFLVYSCNGSWTKEYRLGYLTLANETLDPMVPLNWEKYPMPAFMRSDGTISTNMPSTKGVNGVGHCCFTKSPDDSQDWMVYHSKDFADGGYSTGRSTHIKKITWNADGTPNLGTPPGYGEEIAVPRGE